MVEAVGPMGLVGRPALAANRPQLLGVGLVWASLSDPRWGLACLDLFCFGSWATLGPFELESVL